MKKHFMSQSFLYCIEMLHKKNVIAYPTESMFGLGCDPMSEEAVSKLLNLKKRSFDKGLILVASHFNQIKMYINMKKISAIQIKKMCLYWPGPVTYLLPANPNVPYWITGKFNTVAIRISAHHEIIELCKNFGKAIVSTSANIANMTPSMTPEEVFKYFGHGFPLFHGNIGREKNPSTIIDVINGKCIRHV